MTKNKFVQNIKRTAVIAELKKEIFKTRRGIKPSFFIVLKHFKKN